MNILIRVDSSVKIGTGHVMRCLTFAEMLRETGCYVGFVMRAGLGDLCEYVKNKGFDVFPIIHDSSFAQEKDVHLTIEVIRQMKMHIDWCIVDHYQLDQQWEKHVQQYVHKVMVIDDLANRPHDCHLLLDQNYYKNYEHRYIGLVPSDCKLFLGPKYLILRSEFYKAKKSLKSWSGIVQRLLIFFGGSDPTNETEKVLCALQRLPLNDMEIDVVVGSANPNRLQIKKMCLDFNLNFHCQIDYIADLMKKADLSFGAGGVTMLERCFLGLPSIVTIVADNQRQSTADVAEYGAIWNLGWHEDVSVSDYAAILIEAISHPCQLASMRRKAFELFGYRDKNTIHPVVQAILEG